MTIEREALLGDIQELLNQEVIGETVSDVGKGLELAMERVRLAPPSGAQWISVKDMLPHMNEHYQSKDVLVCIEYRPEDPDVTDDVYTSIDHVDFNCFGQGVFSCERDNPIDGEPSPYFVTHWMPLPEPPDVDRGDTDGKE